MLCVNGTVENGGTITPGAALTMAATDGRIIYYTTDGSDPRAERHRFHDRQHHAQRHDGHGHVGQHEHRIPNGEEIYIGGAIANRSTTASSRSPT